MNPEALAETQNYSKSPADARKFGTTAKENLRPSCARVKVEVDLIGKLPYRVRINEENEVTGDIKSKWISIQYDYMPKYCKECSLQGHDKASYWNVHTKLHEKV
ncbi:hypothetical protein FXO37_08919 [Capsicum annuum]|nr:hypothetical protein FXO37_08919 [Capsicum annuum]